MIEFEKIISLGTYEKPSLSSDRRSDLTDLWLYGIENDFGINNKAIVKNGSYDDLAFLPLATKLSSNKLEDIKVKSLPGFGAYGYITLKKPNTTYLQIPFHINTAKEEEPAISALYSNGSLLVTVLSGTSYDCYRVRITKGNFMQDKIAYVDSSKAEITVRTAVQLPFDVTVIGYKNELAAVSLPAITSLYATKPSCIGFTGQLVTNGTTLTVTKSATVGNALIAFVTASYPFSCSVGWAYRYNSIGYQTKYTTVLVKVASSTSESLTIDTDAKSDAIGITIVEVADFHDISCVERSEVLNMFDGFSIRRRSEPCIYCMSDKYYNAIDNSFDPTDHDPEYYPTIAPITLRADPNTNMTVIQNRLQQVILDASSDEDHQLITTGCRLHEVLTFALT